MELKVSEKNPDFRNARGVIFTIRANHGQPQMLEIEQSYGRLVRGHTVFGAQRGIDLFKPGLKRGVNGTVVGKRVRHEWLVDVTWSLRSPGCEGRQDENSTQQGGNDFPGHNAHSEGLAGFTSDCNPILMAPIAGLSSTANPRGFPRISTDSVLYCKRRE